MNIRAEIFGGPEARKSRLLVGKKPVQEDARALTDVVVPRLETRRTDMRREDRPQTGGELFPILYRERVHQVELVNLSGGGAMIAANLHPNICDRIDLLLAGDEAVECMVRWVKNGRLGLEFAHETQLRCPEDEKIELLRNVVGQSFPSDNVDVEVRPEQSDHRTHDRHPLIWSGELHYNSHAWSVRLRNVSASGAMIECTGALRAGSQVELELGEAGLFSALVSWVVGDLAGIHFSEPFDLNLLAKSKPRIANGTWLKPAYLESELPAELTSDDPWNRMSVDELRTELEGFLKR
jgi:PilZ domain-containing protein